MEIDFSKTTSFKNTEDLMIGNIIQYKKGHLAKVEELNDAGLVSVVGVESNYINGRYDINNFYGIPLSSEVFRMLGFHFSSVVSNNIKRSTFHLLKENGWEAMLSITTYEEKETYFLDSFGKIEYLHELQNYVRIRFKKNLNFNVDEKDLKFIVND
jgi:hypothetical protein